MKCHRLLYDAAVEGDQGPKKGKLDPWQVLLRFVARKVDFDVPDKPK